MKRRVLEWGIRLKLIKLKLMASEVESKQRLWSDAV